MDMENQVFDVLADPTRRHLLDRLFARDGLSLNELAASVAMTRFGVMKHLRVLEDANLVTYRRVGRRKLHYLNPVPIQALYERYVRKFSRQHTAALTAPQGGLGRTRRTDDRIDRSPSLRNLYRCASRGHLVGHHHAGIYATVFLRPDHSRDGRAPSVCGTRRLAHRGDGDGVRAATSVSARVVDAVGSRNGPRTGKPGDVGNHRRRGRRGRVPFDRHTRPVGAVPEHGGRGKARLDGRPERTENAVGDRPTASAGIGVEVREAQGDATG